MKIKYKIVIPIILFSYILSGLYIVRTEEIGIVRLFGRIVESRVQPGIHYALPWPFQQIDRPRVAEIKRISVGTGVAVESPEKNYGAEKSQMVTGDTNIINIQVMLQYTIEDPVKYLFRTKDPQFLISKAASAELNKIINSMPVDEILTTGKIKIQSETKARTQLTMDRYNTGIRIVAANIQSIVPPETVIAAFKDVSSAKADRARIICEAQKQPNNVIPIARGQAEEILTTALSYKYKRVDGAKGEADRFLKILNEYKNAKDSTELRMYLETMEKILPDIKKYLVEGKDGKGPSTTRFIFSE